MDPDTGFSAILHALWHQDALKVAIMNDSSLCELSVAHTCFTCALKYLFSDCQQRIRFNVNRDVEAGKLRKLLAETYSQLGEFGLGSSYEPMDCIDALLRGYHAGYVCDDTRGVQRDHRKDCGGCPVHQTNHIEVLEGIVCECGSISDKRQDECKFYESVNAKDLADEGLARALYQRMRNGVSVECADCGRGKYSVKLANIPMHLMFKIDWTQHPSYNASNVLERIPLCLDSRDIYDEADSAQYSLRGMIVKHDRNLRYCRKYNEKWWLYEPTEFRKLQDGAWSDLTTDLLKNQYHPVVLVYTHSSICKIQPTESSLPALPKPASHSVTCLNCDRSLSPGALLTCPECRTSVSAPECSTCSSLTLCQNCSIWKCYKCEEPNYVPADSCSNCESFKPHPERYRTENLHCSNCSAPITIEQSRICFSCKRETEYWVCYDCHLQIIENSYGCLECHAQTINCPTCSTPLPILNTFCPHCANH